MGTGPARRLTSDGFLAQGEPTRWTAKREGYRDERIVAPYNQFLGEIEMFSDGLNDPDKRRSWRMESLSHAFVLETIRQSARHLS